MNYSVVIVAAGKGLRLDLGYNKVYYPLVANQTMLETTMRTFDLDKECQEIVVVTEKEEYDKYVTQTFSTPIKVVAGGNNRQESVTNGVAVVTEDMVMIHDGARPYVTSRILEDAKATMEKFDACCVMVKTTDTISRVENGVVVETLSRNQLMNAQTPQCFRTELIRDCLAKAAAAGFHGTDDVSVVLAFSDAKVAVVEGDYANYKITTREDLKVRIG